MKKNNPIFRELASLHLHIVDADVSQIYIHSEHETKFSPDILEKN